MTSPPRAAALEHLSPEQVDEVRAVAEQSIVEAVRCVRAMVAGCELRWAMAFAEVLSVPGADPREWLRADWLCEVRGAARSLLGRPLHEILAPLDAIDGARWFRRAPDLASWSPGHPTTGAPGVLVRQVPFWWSPPDGVVASGLRSRAGETRIEPIDDVTIAGRRWIASCVGFELRGQDLPGAPERIAERLGATGPLSEDARIALRALLRERAVVAPAPAPTGFIGPDAWYLSDDPDEVVISAAEAARRGLVPVEVRFVPRAAGLVTVPPRDGFHATAVCPPGGGGVAFGVRSKRPDEEVADAVARCLAAVSGTTDARFLPGTERIELGGVPGEASFALSGPAPRRALTCLVWVPVPGGGIVVAFVQPARGREAASWQDVTGHAQLGAMVRTLRIGGAAAAAPGAPPPGPDEPGAPTA